MKNLLHKVSGRRTTIAFTLIELMITLSISTLFVLGVITFTTITFRQGIFSIGNYTDLNRTSRQTLDIMSRDIRNASGLTYYTYRIIGLTNDNGSQFFYEWVGDKLLRWDNSKSGGSGWKSSVLMTNCDYLRFNIYQRNPTNDFNFVSASGNWNQTKLIDVSWRCSRTYIGQKLNTESVQTARIVMRN